MGIGFEINKGLEIIHTYPYTTRHNQQANHSNNGLTLHSLPSSSPSPFLSSSKTLKTLSKKSTFHLKTRPLCVISLNSSPPQEVQTFWQWLCDQGVVSAKSPIRPATVPEGLGLVAQRDIGRNEVVLEIPKKFWINPDTVAASDIGNLCSGLKPWISVALFLIREKKKEDSPWRVYLDILPESTDSTVFWSEEELVELQGTQLLSTTLGVKEYVQNEFRKVEEEILLPHKQLFPYPITSDDFLWAFGILRSRAFSRLRGQNLVLVPLADLINHSASITTEDFAYEIKGAGLFSRDLLFSLRAPVSVKAGEQVLIQYDLNKSNAELALDYGFIESNSDRNAYTLTLEISESDPFFGDKLDIAESNGLGETAYFDIVLGQPLPPTMVQYLRLVALGGTDAFILESIFRNTVWGHLDLPVSRDNEELICRVVRDACKSALSGYRTTIEEDGKLVEGGNLDPRLRIAVGIRVGEKRVLQQIDGIFKERELELDELEYYQERRLKDLGLVGEQGDIIFWEPKAIAISS
ncbi:fructose-bisphosphate aldolase-lysine N-methyltransferase, chloroplastic [Pistacia vera]|uniref:fructose-bisphosphate aldolase-lysine N-methyltransferase, chloroplastic n=1 Tax=Pistacia vera TaxID=55513 RepID=UPI001263D978|nr:fructose-bisphosphate aldolase-lysine N-methyltransferase, chloroplastic [Pistacia vera]